MTVFNRFLGSARNDGVRTTEDRGQKTEDRKQRTEDRGQKAEDRRQRTEGGDKYRIRHRRTFGIEQGMSNNEVEIATLRSQ